MSEVIDPELQLEAINRLLSFRNPVDASVVDQKIRNQFRSL